MTRHMTVALEVLIILLILFVPLAFGGTQYWAWTVMEAGVAAGLVMWLVISLLNRRLCTVKTPLNIVIAVLLAYVFFQMVPLPAGIAGTLSKGVVALQATGNPGGEATAPSGLRVALSINRVETLQAWFRMLAYGGFFFLLVNFLDTRAKVGRVLGAAVLTGVLLTFLGMGTSAQQYPAVYRTWPTGDPTENPSYLNARADRQFSSGVGYERPIAEEASVHWFVSKTHGGAAFGSFPSQNQAAGFLLMLVPVALGAMFACLGTRRTEWGASGGFLFSREGNLLLLSLMVSLVLMLGVVVTKSRGGVLVMSGFVMLLLVVVAFTGSWLKGVITAVVVGLVLTTPMVVVGEAQVVKTTREIANLTMNPINEGKSVIWDASGRIAKDFALTGTGAGTYGSIYPLYNEGGPQAYFAYNDMLQFKVENGWIGVILGGACLVIYLVTGVVGLVKMKDKFMRRVLLGTLVGTVALLAHSLMDYDLYVPATAFVFVTLAAVTVVLAQDTNSRRTEEDFVF